VSALRIALPGQPVRLIYDQAVKLTPRQEVVLHTVRAFNGNRSRAAKHLGVTVRAVQKSMEYAEAAGAYVPPIPSRVGIPIGVHRDLAPRCGATTRSGPCGRPVGHPPSCIGEKAWYRKRTPERTMFR